MCVLVGSDNGNRLRCVHTLDRGGGGVGVPTVEVPPPPHPLSGPAASKANRANVRIFMSRSPVETNRTAPRNRFAPIDASGYRRLNCLLKVAESYKRGMSLQFAVDVDSPVRILIPVATAGIRTSPKPGDSCSLAQWWIRASADPVSARGGLSSARSTCCRNCSDASARLVTKAASRKYDSEVIFDSSWQVVSICCLWHRSLYGGKLSFRSSAV